ncbi:MAG: carboxypeptidase regulatory-like domain-containing protein, partial [Chloroflexi bacterium]|nr:carboxypeptidase regulatory-like domain-containing protein [Chloroflexota bacterium]
MASSGKPISSWLDQLFRILIVSMILIGLAPLPVMAVTNGAIAGQVSDNSTGLPVSGALVIVSPSGSPTPNWQGNSNGAGNYNVSVPPGVNYQVSAWRTGYITGRASSQNVSDNATTPLSFSLTPGAVIQGTVSDNASVPVQGVTVRAFRPQTPGNVFTSLPTSGSGNYTLTAPQGTGYRIETDKPGYVMTASDNVDIAMGSPVNLNLTIVPTDTVPPANVTNLAAVNPTPNSITMTWTAVG